MVITIAVTHLKQGYVRIDGMQEWQGGGGAATVMGRQQHGGVQLFRNAIYQLVFLYRFDITRQQHGTRPGGDLQGTAARIGLPLLTVVASGRRLQYFKPNTIPL